MDIFEKYVKEARQKEVTEMLSEFVPLCETVAKLTYAYFVALQDAGFTEEQSLFIVSEQGMNVGRFMDNGGEQR